MCCSVLPCAAVCCSALQCVVGCCSLLQLVAASCSVLQRVAACCSALLCAAACCSRQTFIHDYIHNTCLHTHTSFKIKHMHERIRTCKTCSHKQVPFFYACINSQTTQETLRTAMSLTWCHYGCLRCGPF